jgi:hypothetical protein
MGRSHFEKKKMSYQPEKTSDLKKENPKEDIIALITNHIKDK